MRALLLAVALTFMSVQISCTENSRAKGWGGTMTVDLPKGMKLFDVTWKESNLWYAYREARNNENPETVYFVEESSFGLVQGKVVFKEDF